jgi:hypothetical protein
VLRAPLPHLERCNLPSGVAQAVYKKQSFKRADRRPTLYGTHMAERNDWEGKLLLADWSSRAAWALTPSRISEHGCQRPRRRRAGTGVGVCYPKESKKLYEKVPERGASISEFPLGTHPAPKISRFGTASSPACPWVLSS